MENIGRVGGHILEEDSANDYRLGLAVGATIALYKYTYGQTALEKSLGYKPGSADDPQIKHYNYSGTSS